MDQHSKYGESTPFKLPEVQPEETKPDMAFESGANDTSEKAMSQAKEQNRRSGPGSKLDISSLLSTNTIIADNVLNGQPPLTQAIPQSSSKSVTDDLDAADGDRIEKAWVVKAKAIVNQTRDDPYRQNIEVEKIKKDYIKKRYDIDIKTSGE